ncbi:MarR family winged helix-turn-helix transcriptional regulator [Brevibacterium gallinarum]|uniref:MarR family transcriptional regulator n=1 Tax=Brevibacterium gallinarum TaxID=2762220 RepID=A0ABR8WVY2_9MICO|nr:MarR family transcriptional regulator [Brevibacterium gallinarum]MBD8021244.1 MarR family transcriptional regulator [Brevibacterium gallinarum]
MNAPRRTRRPAPPSEEAARTLAAIEAVVRANQRQVISLRTATARFLRQERLSLTDFLVLQLISLAADDEQPASPQEICRQLDISASTLTSITERLCAAEFVVRQRHDTDRRRTALLPTDSATALLQRHHRLLTRSYAEALAAHPGATLTTVQAVIDTLNAGNILCANRLELPMGS